MKKKKAEPANEKYFFQKLCENLPFMDYEQLIDLKSQYENCEQARFFIKEIAHINQAIKSKQAA